MTVYTRAWLETPITIDRVTAHISTAANTRLHTVTVKTLHTREAIFLIRSIFFFLSAVAAQYDTI